MPHEVPDDLADIRQPDREDHRTLPAQSEEDTDVGWGELPRPADDDRFYCERPPHWDSE
jgi:hypothetical protein